MNTALGTVQERDQLARAIRVAQSVGVPTDEISGAEAMQAEAEEAAARKETLNRKVAAERAEAARVAAAEKAERQRAEAAERARKEVEARARQAKILEAKQQLMRSYSLPSQERKALLRDLQVQYHPDKQSQYDDDESKKLAAELSQMVNEAAAVAKTQARAAETKEKRIQAYEALQTCKNGPRNLLKPRHVVAPCSLPLRRPGSSVLLMSLSTRADLNGMQEPKKDELRLLIQTARDAGVSPQEIAKAERRLSV